MSITRRDFTAMALGAGVALAAGPRAFAGAGNILRRPIPSSGETIPVIGLGTNRYGVDGSEAARAPLRAALATFHGLGGELIDTAPGYRTSESVLGDIVTGLGIGEELFLATKVDRTGRDDAAAQMRDSLDKLHAQAVDLMQVHNLAGWQTSIPLIKEWKDAGRVRYVGITTSRESQYAEMERIMLEHDLDFIQVNYSLEQRAAADRLMPLARDRGVAVIINRAFGGGRLFDQVGDAPLPGWAAELGAGSWAQFLLKYALSHPAATVAIPGMTKVRHVEDNMAAGRGPMPDEKQRARMEAFFDAL